MTDFIKVLCSLGIRAINLKEKTGKSNFSYNYLMGLGVEEMRMGIAITGFAELQSAWYDSSFLQLKKDRIQKGEENRGTKS